MNGHDATPNLLLMAIAQLRDTLRTGRCDLLGSLTDVHDLIDFCRAIRVVDLGPGLETQAAPVQLSQGVLHGTVLSLHLGPIDLFYSVCDQHVVFPDRGNFNGAAVAEDGDGYIARWHEAGLFSSRPAHKRSVRIALNNSFGLTDTRMVEDRRNIEAPSPECFFAATDALVGDARRQGGGRGRPCALSLRSADILTVLDGFAAMLAPNNPREATHSSSTARLYDMVDACPDVRIDDMAAQLAMSRRTLHQHTHRHLGQGPKKLVKAVKLRDVALTIPRAHRAGMGIGDLAFEHGFTDFAHFCADYRMLFGERPGETLRRHGLA